MKLVSAEISHETLQTRERIKTRIERRKFEEKKKFAIDFGVWLRAYSEKDTIEMFEKFTKEYEY